MFDPSPTGQDTFSKVKEKVEGLTFHRLGLSAETRRVPFSKPKDAMEGSFGITNRGSSTVEFECLSPRDALARAGMIELELLKIDIEGFEYEVLRKMLAQRILPAQIAVEFHHFLPHISVMQTIAAVRSLRSAGYVIADKEQCNLLFVHRRVLEG